MQRPLYRRRLRRFQGVGARNNLPRIFLLAHALGSKSGITWICGVLNLFGRYHWSANQNTQVGKWLSYDIERAGIASAISNIVYGAPVATAYKNLAHTFEYSEAPLEELMRKAEHKQIELGELMPYVDDGIGIGQAVFTTVQLCCLIGIHPQSIVFIFLALMALVTLAFLARFHDERSVVILVVFLALTIMLASPLGTRREKC